MVFYLFDKAIKNSSIALFKMQNSSNQELLNKANTKKTKRILNVFQNICIFVGKTFVFLLLWYIFSTFIMVCIFKYTMPAATTLSVVRKYANGFTPKSHYVTYIDSVKQITKNMLIRVEDPRFYHHHGVDYNAIYRAFVLNNNAGKILYGGSTLSMQTARTLFLVPVKSYIRKVLEVIVAYELELVLSKKRIMEIYLNWAEWGRGVYGIDSVAMFYYKCPEYKLDTEKTIKILTLLSSPLRYSPNTFQNHSLLKWRYDFLCKNFIK